MFNVEVEEAVNDDDSFVLKIAYILSSIASVSVNSFVKRLHIKMLHQKDE